ncbi:P22 phage major capsid protein family protein [Gilvimarinus chinensis]|uniref:P22 phage major capsid protein family protein n=1 Tax=Gilvimarinus chinensis TaxID=396005 RepID=UPI000364DE2B|nr:P22 phage major capsid protein family protein [Gilvimarinus chinensis]
MANNLSSNTMTKVVKGLAKGFESSQVLTKTVNTSLVAGEVDASTGDTVYLKRSVEALAHETAGGDLTGVTDSIIAGRAAAKVQPYITTYADWTNKEEMLELDELSEYLKPYATRLVTQMELNLAAFMQKNSGLLVGAPNTPVSKWSDVAAANSMMEEMGIPTLENAYYVMNPFTRQKLADAQNGLASGSEELVNQAWRKALIAKDFGGIQALSSNALKAYTAGACTTRTGTVASAPDQTYVTAKDTMTQTLALTGLDASTTDAVRAGDLIRITQAGRTRINPHTKEIIFDADGDAIQYTYVVVTGGDTDASGNVTVTVSAAAINETDGAYNNISTAIEAGDTFSLLGSADTAYKPNLFFHRDAFAVSSIKPPKLEGSADTKYITKGGLTIRVTKFADAIKNVQKIRFDLVPVFACLNPQWAGNAFGES